ncbi:MAG: hypothetical protein HYX59_01080 [Elusimicrobia bacterium]|nr:hypothetical protein [Elusimicrobiota bacterium]
MPDNPKATDGADQSPPERLSKKEFAKKMRREAYLRIKEFRTTDPRQIARIENPKQKDAMPIRSPKSDGRPHRLNANARRKLIEGIQCDRLFGIDWNLRVAAKW